MSRTIGKFIAVILAIWLPLSSGNALAVSIAMHSIESKCHSAAMQNSEHQAHCATDVQHARHDANSDHAAGHHDQQNLAGENCGTCHLACCGYMAAAIIKVLGIQHAAGVFTSFSSQFQSVTTAPLDPPPLTRA